MFATPEIKLEIETGLKQAVNLCRWAPSIGELESTAEEVWGTIPYSSSQEYWQTYYPTVFFGLYGLPDFYSLWRHQGKKWILWAGSDITNFQNGYWLEDGGSIRIDSVPLAQWINAHCESWVENEVERQALEQMGIESKVCPSFLGNISKFPISFTKNERPNVYLSANPGRETEYGWGIIENIAEECDADFYLYGSGKWETRHHNVFVRGRVPKEVMNNEIRNMQSGIRLNQGMDGASEIMIKSVLYGQYPIVWSHFKYPHIDSFSNEKELIKVINGLKKKTAPNFKARSYYLANTNKFPWNTK